MTAAVQGQQTTIGEMRDPFSSDLLVQPTSTSSSAFHAFILQLVSTRSDDSSFDIVVDNPKSGETAAKWNRIRRSSLQHSLSTPLHSTHSRWCSDPAANQQQAGSTSPESRKYNQGSRFRAHSLIQGRRNSFDTCMMGRPALQRENKSSDSLDNMNIPSRVSGSPVKPGTMDGSPPSSPTRGASSFQGYLGSSSEETDYSDFFTSDVEELEHKLKRASQKAKQRQEEPRNSAESALSAALISTIERLSVRAALTMCRPQMSSSARVETMETIEEAMQLLPSRGAVTDLSTSRRRSSDCSFPELDGEDVDSDSELDSQHHPQRRSPMEHPELKASKQHSDLNNAMLAAIDRLSVRAALTLTNNSACYTEDDVSGSEA